ncbi:hypothetical protein BRDID11004_29100 [Bradyrhizobium diazoefficiens]|uniref:Uncharacterized protein n=1 Tax=Bradyrhizobium diazoefficiens TaxID=1355477 RepID=A0A810A6K0_9BRAD|nr:hypothetical protein [Bradyrhizobium diazoefficiens]BBZ96183.1 hypothetical protein F07S3_60160 [Bradyrhizobium diazoefficiens]BCA13868.1 hypothetical protein BDHF08_57150 [Bradyrhizobium diazoefficiens]BCE58278.1 hypothetical protein XF5B_57900 [Bradyrhizobium diazoefficiens]BCE66955.1 hypothetical protein XF6B_57540 [Bradyrhizobium diazoefficiens]
MSNREASDDYNLVVAVLNENWRIIECRDRIQWILQHRGSPEKSRKDDWRGRSYCRTAKVLRQRAYQHAGRIDALAVERLLSLPDGCPGPGVGLDTVGEAAAPNIG